MCQVNYKDETHNGWAAFATAHSAFVLSNDIPFVIVDQPGDFVISKVVSCIEELVSSIALCPPEVRRASVWRAVAAEQCPMRVRAGSLRPSMTVVMICHTERGRS